jgi:hypothetical protein
MSEPAPSPLTRLVLFIACLAIAGSFIAGVHYFALDLPQQQQIRTPENWISISSVCIHTCNNGCRARYDACMATPKGHSETNICAVQEDTCYASCTEKCSCTDCQEVCSDNYEVCLNKPGYTEGDCAGLRDTCHAACPC